MGGFLRSIAAFFFMVSACLALGVEASPKSGPLQYLLVYALDGEHFVFAGRSYDDTAIAPALIDGGTVGAVHVIVMRAIGDGVTVAQLLAVIPALENGKSCLFLQDASSMKSTTLKQKDGKPLDQSFCPDVKAVASSVGPYAPPSQ